jgi:hypothetical protein
MRYLKEVIIIAVAIFFLTSLTAISYAAQPNPIKNIPQVTKSQEIKPLLQPLSLQASAIPSLCTSLDNTINSVIQIAHKDMKATLTPDHIAFPGIWELYYTGGQYRNYVHNCCSQNKSFSVQDQQAAGCTNSDTVGQCMDKLTKYCISQFKTKNELKSQLMQSREKANALSTETKQLSDKLNQLITIMP